MSSHLVIIGPPGAGKGTQATRIADALGIPAISTGDIFRAHVHNRTPVGLQVRRLLDAGEYVPDSLTNAIVRQRLAQPDTKPGFLLDGFPRTPAQVAELDTILAFNDQHLDAVVELVTDTEAVVTRLLNRAQLQGRSDDTEPVIRRRLQVYTEQTQPLITHYAGRGLLRRVDGNGPVEDVTAHALVALPTPARVA